jgi:hypothetical protein
VTTQPRDPITGRYISASAAAKSAPVLSIKAVARLERKKLTAAVRRANIRTLPRAGAYLRTIARRSIKRRKRTRSLPGQPPHTRTGRIKHAIRFDLGPARDSVAIGPARESAGRLWNLLEFGGRRIPEPAPDFTPAVPGVHAPIRRDKKTGKLVRAFIRSADQARRANAIISDDLRAKAARNRKAARIQAARPFMRPALLAAAPALPDFWRNTVVGN